MRISKLHGLLILVHLCILLPLLLVFWDFTRDQLTANPIREIQLRTGKYTLNLLVLTLACSPFYNIFGIKSALKLRHVFGVYAFVYASLHLVNFIGLDYGFNFRLIREDIADKRFVMAGFAAFLILLALMVTSKGGWKNRLGKNWKRLHRLIYIAALLAILHFIWQTKADFRIPFVYGGIVVLLLILRLPRIKELTRIRGKWLTTHTDEVSLPEDI